MSEDQSKPTATPLVVDSIAEVREAVRRARSDGRTIGFVPTMGALHAGHVSLIDAARRDGNFVIVSVYVNPTQFGPGEDFTAYPRTLATDVEACVSAGAHLVFAPNDAEMYPPNEQTRIHPGRLANTMCGIARPGHFEGVCTVVAKLLNIVLPDAAYFGQKDAQQALIIRRMVEDLCFPVRVVVCPIVREADGLAMSSRNAYLSAEERGRALCLFRGLSLGRDRLLAGATDVRAVRLEIEHEVDRVGRAGGGAFALDYVVLVDADTLEPVDRPAGRVLLAGAVRIGKTRLIDNMIVELP